MAVSEAGFALKSDRLCGLNFPHWRFGFSVMNMQNTLQFLVVAMAGALCCPLITTFALTSLLGPLFLFHR